VVQRDGLIGCTKLAEMLTVAPAYSLHPDTR
jgi:hypothetical protein